MKSVNSIICNHYIKREVIRLLQCVSAISISMLASNMVYAQSMTDEGAQAERSQHSGGIEDIVVTAQRRAENLQSIPVSVTALTADGLARSGVDQTSDLQIVTPGLVWSQSLATPTPFIRGVGSRDGTASNENAVATYVDGIYYAAMPAGLLALPNIERIEVLKGPQGTLFGRNANGGLIQIITREPPSNFSGTAKIGYANYSTFTSSLYVGGPITQNLSADLSAYYSNQADGWGKNLLNGQDVNLGNDLALRTKIVWKPSDLLTVKFSADYNRRRSDIGSVANIVPGATAANGRCGAAAFPAGYPGCAPQASATFSGSIYDGQTIMYGYSGEDGEQKAGLEQGGASLTVEQELDFATLRSLTSYRRVRGYQYVSQDGSPEPISQLSLKMFDRAFTEELQLASSNASGFKWIVGAFYMRRHSGYDPVLGYGYSFGLPSALDPLGQIGAAPRFGGSFTVDSSLTVNSLSGYGQATIEVLPATNVTAGLRYTSDRAHIVATQKNAVGTLIASADVAKTFSKVTYRLAVDHQLADGAMIYASYNRGFKSGLFSSNNASGTYAGPETLDAYEIGLKTDFLDRRLRVNIAGFHYDYKGLQLPVIVPGGTQTINAASAKIDGLDFEITAKPISSFTLNLGGSRLFRAKYTDFLNGPLFVPSATGNTQLAADLSGNRVIRSPKFTGNVGANYEILTSAGNVTLNANYFYNSGFFWTPDDAFKQKAYSLLNLSASWTNDSEDVTVQIWGRNVTKTKYYNFVGPASVGTTGVAAEPRTYGVTAQFNF